MKLVVVESPAKAKTISRFLGPDYKVAASYGHIRDLPGSASEIPKAVKAEKWARMAVDVDNGFKPIYVVPNDSKKHIKELKDLLKDADELLLATDEDREGESISWHLLEVLKPKVPVRRIAFHEITKTAIEQALSNPRSVDEQLVKAQESRRILDRLFGYSLSPVLWKKVRTKLSAGRVQSVALRLIVEREEERQRFKSATYWDVEARIAGDGNEFTAKLVSVGERRLPNGKDFDPETGELLAPEKVIQIDQAGAEKIVTDAQKLIPWVVSKVEKKQTKQRPSPPFTTSTLQQAAGNAFGFSPRQTMRVAQELYEGIDIGNGDREGLITYMRTDSFTLSEKALQEAGAFIKNEFGDQYYDGKRVYKTKSKSAQEAHEAIRPTDFRRTPAQMKRFLDEREFKLYSLIWNRALASQMADAILDKTAAEITVEIDGVPHTFRANGSMIKFPGYLTVYGGQTADTVLPDLSEGDKVGAADSGERLKLAELMPLGHETTPPARYTESSLVKRLEEEGIGRPSTYAPTISTIQAREYVVKRGSALIPTYVGMAVVHLLRSHFDHYIDLKFTARMEDALDEIAEGETDWVEFLSKFYHGNGDSGEGLARKIEEELPSIEYPEIYLGNDPETGDKIHVRIGRRSAYVQRGDGGEGNTASIPMDVFIDELTAEKAHEFIKVQSKSKEPLGKHPVSGKNVYALLGPFGPYVQEGESDSEEKPKRTGLPQGVTLADVDFEFALKLLSLPRSLGIDPETGKEVAAGLGRYGPYVVRGGLYRRVESFEKLFTITLEEAIEKLKTAKGRTKEILKELGEHPETKKEIQVATGRYGPYVTDGKVNAKLAKDKDPMQVTMEEALALLAEAAEKKGTRKRTTRKTAAKSSSKAKTTKTTKAKPKAGSKAKTASKTSKSSTKSSKSSSTKATSRKSAKSKVG